MKTLPTAACIALLTAGCARVGWAQATERQLDSIALRYALDSVTLVGGGRGFVSPDTPPYLGPSPLDATEALAQVPGTSLRDNGPAGVTTLRYRGLSGARLRETWEGLRTNDPQLGAADLMEVVPFLTPDLTLGTASAGAQGYALGSRQDTARGFVAQARLSAGRGYAIGVGGAGVRAFGRSDEFRFQHHVPSGDILPEARLRQVGLAGSFGRGAWRSRSYALHTARALAGTSYETLPGGDLTTDHLRQLVGYRSAGWALDAGLLLDRLSFRDAARGLSSDGSTYQLVLAGHYALGEGWRLQTDTRYLTSRHSAYTGRYSGVRTESSLSYTRALGGVELEGELGALGATGRGRMHPYARVAATLPVHGSDARLTASLRRSARLPNLDDQRWASGGDPALAPETAVEADVGLSTSHGTWRSTVGIYAAAHQDYIVWLPGQPFWRPRNVASVRRYGASAWAQRALDLGGVTLLLRGDAAWTLTRLRDEGLDASSGPLPFSPALTAGFGGELARSRWRATLRLAYTGRQYGGFGASLPLDPAREASASLRYGWPHLALGLLAENLFETTLASAEGYPTPGRRLGLTLNYR